MKYSCGLVFLAALVSAQTLTITAPATARAGSPITLTVAGSAMGTNVAGLQFNTLVPTGWTLATPAIGQAGTTAVKQLSCSSTVALCLIVGINQNTIADGAMATLTTVAPLSALPGSYQVSLGGVIMGSPAGVLVTSTTGPAATIQLLSISDINGDGKVDSADVWLMRDQVIGSAPCNNDQNGDGKCTVNDVLIVIWRSLGFTL